MFNRGYFFTQPAIEKKINKYIVEAKIIFTELAKHIIGEILLT